MSQPTNAGSREQSPLSANDQAMWVNLSAVAVAVLAAFTWSYWPTLVSLVTAWDTQPDYSHGYLVVPIALLFLLVRRSSMPTWDGQVHWAGLGLVAAGLGLRILGTVFFIDAIDGWSIPLWIAGVVWLFGGPRILWWALPSIGFLYFMAPLPYRAETLLSVPLQGVATKISCFLLQSLGLPALAVGNVIHLEEHKLEVAEACSGLRMLVSISALAYAYMVLVPRAWWVKLGLVLCVLPVALVSNSLRITATGLLYRYVSTEAAQHFTHDVAGWVMIPVAAALLGLCLWYIGKLFIEVQQLRTRDLLVGQ